MQSSIVYFRRTSLSKGRMIDPAKGASNADKNPLTWLFPRGKMRCLLAAETPLRTNSRNIVLYLFKHPASEESRRMRSFIPSVDTRIGHRRPGKCTCARA